MSREIRAKAVFLSDEGTTCSVLRSLACACCTGFCSVLPVMPAGDVDRDGDVDVTDLLARISDSGAGAAVGALSNVGNTVGWDGHMFNPELADADGGLYTVRFRQYLVGVGRWSERDPFEYVVGLNIFEYVQSRTTKSLDPTGLIDDESAHWRSAEGRAELKAMQEVCKKKSCRSFIVRAYEKT